MRARNADDGSGAMFVVQLPVMALAESAVVEKPAAVHPQAVLNGVRVLVVEDHDDTRELVQAALEELGASVETAASGAEALEAFRAGPPHVVVADIGLPEEDGYALMQRIRAFAEADGGAVPAVALTAYAR